MQDARTLGIRQIYGLIDDALDELGASADHHQGILEVMTQLIKAGITPCV